MKINVCLFVMQSIHVTKLYAWSLFLTIGFIYKNYIWEGNKRE